ncbi:YPDG domain-containing protein [Staphylococcus hominis]|nr:Rib/alpha-like domain-containing protein [Staphylococcus hominis]UNQ67875.1 YPDG domain-containing protein [Staphylococcus hominis]
MKKKPNRRLDFLPNVQNKYSIRKFTVGAASILVGATLIFGAGQEEAKAAESDQTVTNQDNTSSTTDTTEQPSTEEKATSENITTDESSAEEKEVSESATTDQQSTETKEVSDNTETSQQSSQKEKEISESTTTEQPSPEEKAANESTQTDEPSTEEKAANESTQTDEPSTEEKAADESTQTDESSAEEKAADESTQTDKSSSEEKAAESTQTDESSAEEKAADESTQTDKSSSEEKAAESTQTDESSSEEKEANDSTETNQPSLDKHETTSDVIEQPEASASIQTISEELNVSSDDTVQALENIGVDTSNASEVEAIAALIQNDYANNSNETPVATPLNVNSATTRNEETTNTLRPRLFAAMALAADTPTNDNVSNTDNNQIIEADAIKNGYINSPTDATNAANTLSGRAWVVDNNTGTPSTMSNGLSPVPEGTSVYMQWIDKDGVTSPIYKASTTNSLGKSEASQVGPGAYAFDLRTPYVDANGKEHKYRAVDGQYYRIWIEDYKTQNGNTATMLRTAGGFLPGSYVNSVTGNNIGQFPLIGTNMQRTGIFMGVEPDGEYMTRPKSEWIHDTQGADRPLSTNSIHGRVWLETGTGGDLANSATGPNYNPLASDRIADGYTVVFSTLTDEGVQAYKNQVESLPEAEQAEATKTLLTDHPEYISATVYGETNADGYYTLHFPSDTKINNDYIYGYVMNPNGENVLGYSNFISPVFNPAFQAGSSFTPQTAPVPKPAKGGWYNVNFALVPTADTKIDIVKYNNTTQPAQPGDTVNIDLSGSQLSPLPTHIEWRDSNGNVVQKTDDITSYTDGEQKGTFVVPNTAKAGDVYTVYLVSGGKDVGSDSFVVATQEKSYHPKTNEVTKDYGTPTTEEDVTGAVTIPDYPSEKGTPTITVDDPSTLPDGNTPGTVDVPVTVTYPDGTEDHVTVPVTTNEQADNDAYQPTTDEVTKDYGTPTTEEDVTGAVTIPDYPSEKGTPTITVDDPSTLPDGNTPGTVEVPVTVTYPDGTEDHVTVPVTTNEQADNDAYQPTTDEVTKDYGTPTTEEDVTGAVTIPDYPSEKGTPTITVDDPSTLPDGNTPGTVDVPVTVTYPDGTEDHVTVPVTTNEQADNDAYQPTTDEVTKDYGTPTTEEDVTVAVTLPDYPSEKEQPVITVDNPDQLPDGNTPGTTEVDVTVTYPDGTKDHVKVPVTVGEEADNDAYDPNVEEVNKDYGTPTTEEDVTGAVTVPDYPSEKEQPVITVDNPDQLPDGNTPGTTEVDVTVTYPDGTKDHVKVPVTVGEEADNDAYDPNVEEVNKDYGTPTTEEDVTGAVTVPDYPSEKEQPVITVDNPDQLPDGNTPGTTEVDVTVTYPDGTKDHVKVPVTVGEEADNDAYDPNVEEVNKDYGTPTTEEDVTGAVTVPDYPSEKEQPVITVDNPDQLPDGNTPGTTEVDVTVTYPDGTKDHVKVPVTVGEEADNDAYDPNVEEVNKDYGTPTTEEDVTGAVTVPDYPSEKEQPVITVDNPDQLPDGNTPGTTEVDVTVTYPDGTKDHVKVPVTVGEEADNDAYDPNVEEVNKDYGTPTTEEDVTGAVTVPDYPSEKEQPVITVDDPNQLPDGNTPGTTEVDVTVTYPDGTKDHVKVPVIVGEETQANTNDPGYDNVTVDPGETVKVPQTGDNTMPDGTQYEIDKSKVPSDWEVTVDHNTGELTVKPSEDAVPGTSIVIPVTVTYPDGSTEEVSTTITVGDVIDIPAPTVNPVDDNDTEVTGTDGTPGNTIVVTFPDGSTSEGNIDKDGNWTVDIPDGVDLDKGDVITVVEKDKDGKVSTPTKVVVGENCDNPSNGDNSGDGAGNDSSDGDNSEDGTGNDSSDGDNSGDGAGNDSSDGDNSEDGADKGSSNEDNSKDEEGNNSLDSNNSVEGNKDSLTDNNATTDSNNTASVNNTDQTDSNNDVSELNEDNNTSNNTHKQNNSEAKALPETGNNEQNNGTLLGSLFAATGALFLAGKRRKNRTDKK